MVLGNYAMQRGWDPAQVTDWFHRAFVDGYDWVMVPNVVGMSQYADGGLITTKPYAGGGAYIDRMSDYCGGCRLHGRAVRVGEEACPFTAGYWSFLNRHRRTFAGNHRMAQPVRGLDRLKDLELLVVQEDAIEARPRRDQTLAAIPVPCSDSAAFGVVVPTVTFVVQSRLVAQSVLVDLLWRELDVVRFGQLPARPHQMPKLIEGTGQLGVRGHHASPPPRFGRRCSR